jgi:DNA-binding transcriptional LysR family regulator
MVSKQIAKLEQTLGGHLIVRTTRNLTLTEAGVRSVAEAAPRLKQMQNALEASKPDHRIVSGILKVSLATGFGRSIILPMMPPLLQAHPKLCIDWHFDNQQVDIIGQGFDVAIGGGFDISSGLVARPLLALHLVLVAAPSYLQGKPVPQTPFDLLQHEALMLRSSSTGRTRNWNLQSRSESVVIEPNARFWFSAPEALADAAVAGYGIGLAGMSHVYTHLAQGTLVRLLPDWYVDVGHTAIYFPLSRLMPPKTRVFIDHISHTIEQSGLVKTLSAKPI